MDAINKATGGNATVGAHGVTAAIGIAATLIGAVLAADTLAGVSAILVSVAGLVTAVTGLVRVWRQRPSGDAQAEQNKKDAAQ